MNYEGDVVLVYYQDKPAVYARIESVEQDMKKDWYQVTLLLLTIPAQRVTWILREEYFNGTPFTMGGNSMLIEEVKRVKTEVRFEDDEKTDDKDSRSKPAKVIPFKGSPK
jgi:hypothetical protein